MPRNLPLGDETLSSSPVAKQPIWDLPTRLFHWLLVALVSFSWWSGKNGQIDLHIWSGIAILSLLIFQDPAPLPVMDMSVWIDRRFGATTAEALARSRRRRTAGS